MLVESILENENFTEIRAILIADWLKEMLFQRAEKLEKDANAPQSARLRKLIRQGTDLIRQPPSSPDDNHLHLSLISRSRRTKIFQNPIQSSERPQ